MLCKIVTVTDVSSTVRVLSTAFYKLMSKYWMDFNSMSEFFNSIILPHFLLFSQGDLISKFPNFFFGGGAK